LESKIIELFADKTLYCTLQLHSLHQVQRLQSALELAYLLILVRSHRKKRRLRKRKRSHPVWTIDAGFVSDFNVNAWLISMMGIKVKLRQKKVFLGFIVS